MAVVVIILMEQVKKKRAEKFHGGKLMWKTKC